MGITVGNTVITFNDATTQSTAAVPAATALNATGSAPLFACRAWVNFDGTGTVAIRASGNVSSITDNGTGDYTVDFTTAMPDANYAITVSSAGGFSQGFDTATARTTSAARIRTANSGNSAADSLVINLTVVR
jgi:hypothetical protein